MKKVSARNAARRKEVKPFRDAMKVAVGRCEYCLKKAQSDHLECDEIARGCFRQMALDAAYAIIVVHSHCHRHVQNMSRAKRLAILMLARPEQYDLEAFWSLTRRRWPDQEDIDREAEALLQERLTNGHEVQPRSPGDGEGQ